MATDPEIVVPVVEEPSTADQIAEELATPPVEQEPEVAAPPVEEDLVEIDGEKMTRAEARGLVDFRRWAVDHQKEIAEFGEYLEGRLKLVDPNLVPPPVPPSTPKPEEEEDLSELPESVRARLGQLDQLKEAVDGLQAQTFDDVRARNLNAVDQAAVAFQNRYGLSNDDMEQLQMETARAGIFPAMVQAAGRDVQRGAEDSFEAIYFRNPKNRQRELDRISKANKEATDRQRKAGKLAGSGGTTPRAPEPTKLTSDERRAAIIEAIAADQRGGSE